MHAVMLCTLNELTYATRIFEYTPEIDGYSFVDPTTFPRGNETLPPADVVVALVNAGVSNESFVQRVLKLVSLFSSNEGIPTLVVSLNGRIPSDQITAAGYGYLACEGSGDEDCLRVSEVLSALIGETSVGSVASLHKMFKNFRIPWRTLFGMLVSLTLFFFVLAYRSEIRDLIESVVPYPFGRALFVFLGIVLSSVFVVAYLRLVTPVVVWALETLREGSRRNERLDAAQYYRRLRRVIADDDGYYPIDMDEGPIAKTRSMNAIERMLINLEDINQYYKWSQDQARSAFRLARALCVAGFVFLIIGAVLPAVFGLGTEASIVLAVGGAITELVAGTALIVYKSSLTQLNHYHDALHEDERFLSSVSLIDRFSTPEKQDEILAQIVRTELDMNLESARRTDEKLDAKDTKHRDED